MFIKLDDALDWLYTRKRFSRREDLSLIEEALRLLGNPEKSFRSIHIAGTNGKGSTSMYIYNILLKSGIKAGLFTSPHITCFNERIMFMGENINDSDLLRLINKLYEFNNEFMKTHETLTFFEITTIISMLYYKERGAEIVVYECGLGGRLDATNVIHPLVSIITVVEKDHMDVLGNTYKKIAKEKLGIVKYKVPLITAESKEELMPLFKAKCDDYDSELHLVRNVRSTKLSLKGTNFTYKGFNVQTPLIGLSQPKNASMAIECALVLRDFYNIDISYDSILNGIKDVFWPARFEFITGNIIIDGSHNEGALNECFTTLKRFSNKKIVEIFGCMKDKDYPTMVSIIDENVEKVYFTKIDYPRALDPIELKKLSTKSVDEVYYNTKKVLKYAIKHLKKDEILLINGSLYLASEAREILMRNKKC